MLGISCSTTSPKPPSKRCFSGPNRLGKVAWIFTAMPREDFVTRPVDVEPTGPLDGFVLAVITPGDFGVLEVPLPD
jgi:hypothetical protein